MYNPCVRKRIAVLGSTGSIGRQTLEVAAEMKDGVEIVALSAYKNAELLVRQAYETGARTVCIADGEECAADIQSLLPTGTRLLTGIDGLCELATMPDYDMAVFAIFGSAGLKPLVAAIEAGHDIAFANKESLVAGGRLVMDLVRKNGVTLLPIDSEHNSVFRCLSGKKPGEVRGIILAATGGPFRKASRDELSKVTLKDALNHPVWTMGKRITVNSATMFNKALEIIEAHHLFGIDESAISVLIHPQSVVHGMVELADGTMMAHLAPPDMKYPIRHCLSYPAEPACAAKMDPVLLANLEFQIPDENVFTPLKLGRRAIKEDWTFAVAMNATNEILVDRFLCGKIGFTDILSELDSAAESFTMYRGRPHSIDEILALDAEIRSEMNAAAASEG